MSLTSREIETTYQAILDRMPSPAEIANTVQQHSSLKALRQAIVSSEEFYLKFQAMRTTYEARQTPILVHPLIPETAGDALLDALATAPELQPARQTDEDGIAPLRSLPRPERLKLRLVQGDLDFAAGARLALPYRTLCILRRPGPRLWRLWRLICPTAAAGATTGATAGATNSPDTMRFGDLLEYSLNSVPHRLEMDNGQVRRLAGTSSEDGFGSEPALLRRALHMALAPDTVLGLAEHPASVLEALSARDLIAHPESCPPDDPDDMAALDEALAGLSKAQRAIFDGYTAWDDYLYEVCAALLFPPSNKEAKSS